MTNATATAAGAKFWIEPVDARGFSPHRIGEIRHNYNQHPLMSMKALQGLAKRLYPQGKCRFIKPGTTQKSDFATSGASPDGREIDQIFDRIQEAGSWIALYNIEVDPEYNAFLKEVTRGVKTLVDRDQPGMFNVCGFIFISAPPSVTPFHIDRENNFWLQIHGRKLMSLWDPDDRATVPHPAVEKFIVSRSLDDVKLSDGDLSRVKNFDVGPGQGVYFPSTSPHMTKSESDWVKTSDGVSVSIGVVFYTLRTMREARIHLFNSYLRRLGMAPNEPGRSGADFLKAPLGHLALTLQRKLRGYEPPPGFFISKG